MLTANNMYSPQKRDKLLQRPRTYLSKKRKIIFAVFIPILKSAWNFVYFKEEDQLHSLNISEVIDSDKCSYLNAKKQLFQNTLLEWTCSRVPNPAQILMAALLS